MDGNGYNYKKDDSKEAIIEDIYKSVNKYPFDNKNIKKIYNTYLFKPLSDKAVELLHQKYNNKSDNLTNL